MKLSYSRRGIAERITEREMVGEKWKGLKGERWVVLVCAMWVQCFAGMAYMFGSISPTIKTAMGYNQRQLAVLATAKDLGDNIGFVAGKLSQVSPLSRVLLVGALHNFVGYFLLWLVVTHRIPSLPLWALCICIYVGANAATYYNTASLVSCVKNFPENRGSVVGILKGFAGLSGAIMTQIVAMINTPDQASLIFIIAVGPTMVGLSLMFIIRPIRSPRQARPSDGSGFLFIYCVCLLLASYLMGVLMLQNMMDLNQSTIRLFGVILIILILLPVMVPIFLVFFSKPKTPDEETLLVDPLMPENVNESVVGEVADEKPIKQEANSVAEGPRQILQLQVKILQAVTEALKKIKQKNGPEIGGDFTLMQAMAKPDLWLLFFSLVMGSGSGLTIINNMGQICQSLGDNNANVYVAMISIFNFLGRIGGGYFSEVITRKFAYPRPVALAMVQAIMITGLSYYAMGWSGQLYVVTVLTGLGYGAHWSIGPAVASELFGLKNFGPLYNFLTLATPSGSLILSGMIASNIYDYYAEQQGKPGNANEVLVCEGKICYSMTCGILAGACLFGMVLSFTLVHRTKRVYAQLYGRSPT